MATELFKNGKDVTDQKQALRVDVRSWLTRPEAPPLGFPKPSSIYFDNITPTNRSFDSGVEPSPSEHAPRALMLEQDEFNRHARCSRKALRS